MAVIVETAMGQDLELGVSTTSKTHPSGGTLSGHQINLGTFSTQGADGLAVTATWDAASIDAGAQTSTTVTVTGASVGDLALASFNATLSGLHLWAEVTAADTVTVFLSNLTGSAVDLGSGIIKVAVFAIRTV